jgi:beta-glucosidase
MRFGSGLRFLASGSIRAQWARKKPFPLEGEGFKSLVASWDLNVSPMPTQGELSLVDLLLREILRLSALAALLLLLATPAIAAPRSVADGLVDQMTLAEKIAQLQSTAPAIPRLGVPAYNWWSEGLHGLARNGQATVFPQAIGLAATWDVDLMRGVGETVSTEARAKLNTTGGPSADHGRYQGLTIWSPNINIDRDPRWGRGQETYGEDPFLTGRLAVGFIQGLQGPDPAHPRAIATAKHFAVHSGPELGRHGFDVDVAPYDLEATYTPAFRTAVTEGGAQSVMCAYNALHGLPVCASTDLLADRLRRDWGFQGYVVSDCDAVEDMTFFHFFRPDNAGSSAASVKAGTDLDCGTAYAGLAQAAARGEVSPKVIDRAVRRLFAARERLGLLGGPDRYAGLGAAQLNAPASRDLALRAARESLVLLKNADARLPLAKGLHLAVVGPNADAVESLEANYHGTAVDPITPLAGLRARFGAGAVTYAQGSGVAEGAPVTVPESALRTSAEPNASAGLVGAYYDGLDFSGAPRLTRTDRVIAFDLDHAPPAPGLNPNAYAVRWRGVLIPPGPGTYQINAQIERCWDCRGHDRSRLYVDGAVVFDDDGSGRSTQAVLTFTDTRPHAIRFEFVHSGQDEGVRLGWIAPASVQLAEAAAAAAASDAVVAFVGLSPDVEGEELQVVIPGFDGGDRTDIELPAPQRRLLETLAATGKPLIVVLMSGGAVASPFADAHADAVLAAWYPGQAGGQAIAETLAGDVNPSGRLPVTFYRSTKDLPAFADYRMVGRTYRYFTGTPLYPFGFGLSYTRFAYGPLRLSGEAVKAGESVTAKVEVRNVGDRPGDEVAQLYLSGQITPGQPAPGQPLRSLVGFQRVHLQPGETRELSFTLSARDLSRVDPAGHRAVEAGRYGLFVGGAQPDPAASPAAVLTVQGREALPR